MTGRRFPKESRLRKRREFLAVQQGSDSLQVSASSLLALARPNGTERARLGLTVSSKVGNAVTRNRIRRQLREWFRAHIDELPKGYDVVVIARNSAATASPDALGSAFHQVAALLRKKAKA